MRVDPTDIEPVMLALLMIVAEHPMELALALPLWMQVPAVLFIFAVLASTHKLFTGLTQSANPERARRCGR